MLDDVLRGAEGAKLGVALDDGVGLDTGLLGLRQNRDLSAHLRQFERTWSSAGYHWEFRDQKRIRRTSNESNDCTSGSASREEARHCTHSGPRAPSVRDLQRRVARRVGYPCIVRVLGALVDGERNGADQSDAGKRGEYAWSSGVSVRNANRKEARPDSPRQKPLVPSFL